MCRITGSLSSVVLSRPGERRRELEVVHSLSSYVWFDVQRTASSPSSPLRTERGKLVKLARERLFRNQEGMDVSGRY